MTRAWTRSCAACSVRKGLIFLMLCSANLQDRAVFAMCSLKVSWSSKITPRFLTEADEVVKSCCRVGVAGKTRSSVFARLSYEWWSFIHAETATLGLCSLSSVLLLSAIHQFLASQCFTFMNRLVLMANVCDEFAGTASVFLCSQNAIMPDKPVPLRLIL